MKRKFYKAPPSGSSTILGSAPPRRVQLELDSYQNARLLYKRGKLQSKNNQSGSADYSHYILGGVGVVFLAGFVTTPSLGRKMARDDEFRQKWVPSWYDLTVQKPEFAWTRKELHEHAVAAEKELHERAIRGDFSPRNLRELQERLDSLDNYPFKGKQAMESQQDPSVTEVPTKWTRLHPGIENDSELNEED